MYQWGIYKRTGEHTKIKYPKIFPNKCFNVQLTPSIDDP
ncbi:gp53-like domain-containing protein [Proteus mirabilis]